MPRGLVGALWIAISAMIGAAATATLKAADPAEGRWQLGTTSDRNIGDTQS